MRKPNRRPNVTCVLCGTPMYRRPWTLAKGEGKYCSRACRNRAHPLPPDRVRAKPMYGPNNPAWKGGVTYRRRRGNYVSVRYVRCPSQMLPMARKDGYVMEHRLVVATILGRPLLRSECVHHHNHNPLDNRPENLSLFASNRDHKLYEHHGSPLPIWDGAISAAA